MLRLIVFLLALPCVTYGVRWTEFPSGLSPSSSRNLHSLTPSSLVPFLRSSNLSVVWFHPRNVSSDDRTTYYLLRESFFVPAAARLNIPFAEYPTHNDSSAILQTLGVNESDIDTVHIYSRLRRIVYHGLRTPDALVSFVEKLKSPKFSVIEGKADKKQFDLLDKVRVLAYVTPGSAFARAYAHAALAFGPSVKFFVIKDALTAKRYGLTDGSVQLHRPGERAFVELPMPKTAAEIVSFVREEGGKAFFQIHPLSTDNIYSFFREDYNQSKFVLLTSYAHSPQSHRFHKLLRRSIKNDTQCQIHVIDVDLFPGMADYWKRNFGVDPSTKPVLGFVSLHNKTGLWLDGLRSLNNTDGRESEMQNSKAISDFVGSIKNGTVTLEHGQQVDPNTGVLSPRRDRGAGSQLHLLGGDVVNLKVLEDEVLGHEGSYESEDAFGSYNADKRRLNYEGGNVYRQEEVNPWAQEISLDRLENDRAYAYVEDEPAFSKHAANPASQFGQDLSSFGAYQHLDTPPPSVAAHNKRHNEF